MTSVPSKTDEPRRPSLFSSLSRTFSSSSSFAPASSSGVHTAVPTTGDGQQNENQNTRLKTFVKTMIWMGTKVAETVDYVGEGVVSVLGLDDSRFQDVLDNMTDEQREYAEAVHAERQQEYRDAGILVDEVVPTDDSAELATVSSAGNSVKVDVESGRVETTKSKTTTEIEMSAPSTTSHNNSNSSSTPDVVDSSDIVVGTADNV